MSLINQLILPKIGKRPGSNWHPNSVFFKEKEQVINHVKKSPMINHSLFQLLQIAIEKIKEDTELSGIKIIVTIDYFHPIFKVNHKEPIRKNEVLKKTVTVFVPGIAVRVDREWIIGAFHNAIFVAYKSVLKDLWKKVSKEGKEMISREV